MEKVFFDRNNYMFVGIDEDLKIHLKDTYRHINIEDELRKMALWLTNNPNGKKRLGSLSFITNWLNKSTPTNSIYDERLEMVYNESPISSYLKDYLKGLWTNREHLLNLNTISR